MINRNSIWIVPALATVLVACSDDSKKYTAEFPSFDPLEAKSMSGGALRVGSPVVVTANESKHGNHLYEVNYKWTVSGPENVMQRYNKRAVYSDKTPSATDTIRFSAPGRYVVTFVASYEVAGVGKGQAYKTIFPDNKGTAVYDGSALRYRVTVDRTFVIED